MRPEFDQATDNERSAVLTALDEASGMLMRPGLADAPEFGAHLSPAGVSFRTMPAPGASKIELCLYDPQDLRKEIGRFEMDPLPDGSWTCLVKGLGVGAAYGYRVDGPWNPYENCYFNPHKLVLDPFADCIVVPDEAGRPRPDGMHLVRPEAFRAGEWRDGGFTRLDNDTGAFAPKAVVIDHGKFDWRGDVSPDIPADQVVLLESHIRGATKRHPAVAEAQRGTYLGFVSSAHLSELRGVANTIELMPVSAGADDLHLRPGASNYWNYNPVGAFAAPEPRYSAERDPQKQIDELKEMVRVLHAEGFKVVLDVVFNHTAEGSECGPLLSLRAFNDDAYLRRGNLNYVNLSGCGNTLNLNHPATAEMLINALRQWVENYHIDGFRFDLGSIGGAQPSWDGRFYYRPDSLFFRRISEDPVLAGKAMWSENWAGAEWLEGYQVGNPPQGFSGTWNGRSRDDGRELVIGSGKGVQAVGDLLCGSPGVYGGSGSPLQSLNFVTCHDGFTLADLVSYVHKHNEANGEDNRDGESHNRSTNCGVEGPTLDPAILERRSRLMKMLHALTMLSAGTPMLYEPDMVLHTQAGNNNAYCQDNATTWIDWGNDPSAGRHRDFLRGLYRLRQDNPGFRAVHYAREDLEWYGVGGGRPEWEKDWVRCVGALYKGGAAGGADIYTILNFSGNDSAFTLPGDGRKYELLMDSSLDWPFQDADRSARKSGEQYTLKSSSIAVFRVVE